MVKIDQAEVDSIMREEKVDQSIARALPLTETRNMMIANRTE